MTAILGQQAVKDSLFTKLFSSVLSEFGVIFGSFGQSKVSKAKDFLVPLAKIGKDELYFRSLRSYNALHSVA